MVGNKCDLDEERQVTFEEGEEFAKDNGMLFFEVSAKTGHNIEQVFEHSSIEIERKIEENLFTVILVLILNKNLKKLHFL